MRDWCVREYFPYYFIVDKFVTLYRKNLGTQQNIIIFSQNSWCSILIFHYFILLKYQLL